MSRPSSANGVVVVRPLRLGIGSKDILFYILVIIPIAVNGPAVTRSSLRMPTTSCISCAFIQMNCRLGASGPDASQPSRPKTALKDILWRIRERSRSSVNGPGVRPGLIGN